MRLWSLHPCYLDAKGLVALWREGLLAKKVLDGATQGYRNHPQLIRFRDSGEPQAQIDRYLHAVLIESRVRGYRFDATKLSAEAETVAPMRVTAGQLGYEWQHLLAKLKTRDPERYDRFAALESPEPHPSFVTEPGPVADWERI